MRKRASIKDKQSEIRTKVPDEIWDTLEAYAAARNCTTYVAARQLIISGLAATTMGRDCALHNPCPFAPLVQVGPQ